MRSRSTTLRELDESPLSGFHLKTVITAGMGFLTDAYDLFIIGVVSAILKPLWHLDTLTISLLSSTALLAAALGAVVFGRISDRLGRRFVYGYELLVLAAGAIASALSPNVFWLLIFRFILGMGVGGDYPVSSTLMSEYSNRRSRGKLITLVFSTQALGLIIGPLLTILLLLNNVDLNLTWRLLLGLGAVPALATFWLRRQIAESPRFSLAHGDIAEADRAIEMATNSQKNVKADGNERERQLLDTDQTNQYQATESSLPPRKKSWIDILTTPYMLVWLIGTAGAWFLLDFAYYGTTVSTPLVIKLFSPKTTLLTTMIYTLLIFVVAALPGYIVAVFTIDRIGRKKIQLLGFAMMTLSYGLLFLFPVLTTIAATFLLLYGLSYFFTEFGPNVTTFVYPAEIFPVSVRSTGHGISAAVGKVGAFIGAFLFPLMLSNPAFRLPGAMGAAAIVALGGFLITFLLPEPDTKSLEAIEKEGERLDEKVEEEKKVRSKTTSSLP
ncbi:MAG TPA: MFS transporter [Ktedonobacteraceae bacterium]|nr:MFS transporter [Ktedonobacteraceae bacterium]